MFIVGGAILGVLVLGEPMTAKRALGMLLAIAGALLVATESASTPGAPANFDQVLVVSAKKILEGWSWLGHQAPLCAQVSRVDPPGTSEYKKPRARMAFAVEDRYEVGFPENRWRRAGPQPRHHQ